MAHASANGYRDDRTMCLTQTGTRFDRRVIGQCLVNGVGTSEWQPADHAAQLPRYRVMGVIPGGTERPFITERTLTHLIRLQHEDPDPHPSWQNNQGTPAG